MPKASSSIVATTCWLSSYAHRCRWHFLDFADMQPEEQTSYGPLLHRLYTALKQVMGAKRIYTLVLLEEQPHFHAWLVPRLPTESNTKHCAAGNRRTVQ
jgi:diadenosine tetraphosphate (Ap4A) HIT family hydrolase